MAKPTNLVLILVVAVAIWGVYAAYVSRIESGPQGDPVRAVEAFMNATAKVSTLLWDEQALESLRNDLKAWQEAAKEGDAEMPESLKNYGLEDLSGLFTDERYGKAALTALSLYHFDSFSADPSHVGENTATVTVTFIPHDFMGLRRTVSQLGAPESPRREEPVTARFQLKKKWHAWYIEDIQGQMTDVIGGFERLRRYK